MIEFNLKGIRIEARVHVARQDYRDAGGHYRSRFDREVKVVARFWDFTINGDLTEFAFVKSTLNYFMHAYWKRSGKEASKIDLAKVLQHQSPHAGRQSLYFVGRQKEKKRFLHVCLQQTGTKNTECYLDGQEVIMLDIALGKAINLLAPATSIHGQGMLSLVDS